jgi:hypothetical protein
MGWMMQVAAMPDMPPFTNGLAAFQAAGGSDFWAISAPAG